MKKNLFQRFVLVAALVAATVTSPSFTPALFAQATMTETTLAAAITSASAQVIVVTSGTGFAVGNVLVVDGEAMTVQSSYVSGVNVPVTRGVSGTVAGLHASGATVLQGQPQYFSKVDPNGPCTSTNELALPRVVLGTIGAQPPSVSVYNCTGVSATTQRWQQYTRNGYPAFPPAALGSPSGSTVTYTTAGAINPQPGSIFINGTTLAMTLINPTLAQNGMIMVISATNASAHTLTYTAGFNGGTTARDVATFGGAVGDNIVVYANAGVWWVISTRNVTLG